jgi:VCBS repeat-containing protein
MITTAEDASAAITLAADDPDGDALTYAVVSQPSHGTLSGTAPNFTYAPNAGYNGADSFTFKANDGHIDSTIATISITVTPVNDAPVVSVSGTSPVDEGGLFTGSGSFADTDLTDAWTATVDYGDGSGLQPLLLALDKTFTLSHIYVDNGAHTVTVAVTDGQNASGSDSLVVTVNNVAPVVGAITVTPNPVVIGEALSASASFTDAGALDTHTAQWNWGDNTTSTGTAAESNGSGSASGSHLNAQAGVYTVTLTVTDKDGGSATVSSTYAVRYNFSGFLDLVSLGKPFKLGSTVPMKFQLTDAKGGSVSNAIASLTIQQYSGGEPVGDPIEVSSSSGADTGNTFRYSTEDNQYIYNLNTKGLSQGTWQISAALDDGTVRTAVISLK